MKRMKKYNKTRKLVLYLLVILSFIYLASAEPVGLSITSNSTETAQNITPDNRTDDGGTINTLTMDIIQQTTNWKAYVGNVSGELRLSDSDGSSIFTWALSPSEMTGEIYSSRSNNVAWGNIRCADSALITAEDTTLGMSGVLNISQTFNTTTHQSLIVGTTDFGTNNCSSTSTYVNDASQSQATADFQLILLDDTTNLVYTTPINPATTGFDGSSYDFQMITPNDPDSTTTYFFYAEISS